MAQIHIFLVFIIIQMFLTTFFILANEVYAEIHKNPLFQDCSISACSSDPVEIDHYNNKWPRYCYQCPEGEDQVIFLRKYGLDNWEYVVTKHQSFEGRIMLSIVPCFSPEVDSMGNIWTTWCFGKQVVQFEKIGEKVWVFKQDFSGGYPQLQYRRILFNQVFLDVLNKIKGFEEISNKSIQNIEQTKENSVLNKENSEENKENNEENKENSEKTKENRVENKESIDKYKENSENPDLNQAEPSGKKELHSDKHPIKKPSYHSCRQVEGDSAGRYFFQEFSESGEKISFQQDSLQNFLLNPSTLSRIPSSFLQLPPIPPSSNPIPCRSLDSNFILLTFEPDIYVPNMFWRRDLEDGQFINYVRSSLKEDKQNGMYLIDEETGKRLRNFI